MMKKIFPYLMIFSLLFASCNDWLDVKPRTQKDAEEIFNEEQGLKDALIACYIKMNEPELYGKSLTVTDIEYLAQHWHSTDSGFEDQLELKAFDYETIYALNFIEKVYNGLYNVIVQANTLIEQLPDAEVEGKALQSVIKAEALAMRAFCHLDILRLFGEVPKVGTRKVSLPYSLHVSKEAVPYYDFNGYVQKILDDLAQAENLFSKHDPVLKYTFFELNDFNNENYDVELEDSFLGYRRFRFNYYAVKAIRARLYLYAGDHSKAYSEAKAIIDAKDAKGNPFLSLAGTADFLSRNYTLPSECIMALSNSEMGTNFGFNSTRRSDRLFSAQYGLFLPKDRLETVFAGRTASDNRYLNVWNTLEADQQGNIKPIIKKYNQPEIGSGFTSDEVATLKQVMPLIRFSEIYLIAIETSTSREEANQLYATYLAAKNITAQEMPLEELRKAVIEEYRREFFAEGQMFYTYKRTNSSLMLWGAKEIAEENYIVPVPASEYKQ